MSSILVVIWLATFLILLLSPLALSTGLTAPSFICTIALKFNAPIILPASGLILPPFTAFSKVSNVP